LSAAAIEHPANAARKQRQRSIHGVAKVGDRLVLTLDLDAVLGI